MNPQADAERSVTATESEPEGDPTSSCRPSGAVRATRAARTRSSSATSARSSSAPLVARLMPVPTLTDEVDDLARSPVQANGVVGSAAEAS